MLGGVSKIAHERPSILTIEHMQSYYSIIVGRSITLYNCRNTNIVVRVSSRKVG